MSTRENIRLIARTPFQFHQLFTAFYFFTGSTKISFQRSQTKTVTGFSLSIVTKIKAFAFKSLYAL